MEFGKRISSSFKIKTSSKVEKINKYYGRKLSKYDVGELLTDFYEGDGFEFISSNEKFEKWLDRNKEFYLG